MYVIIIKNIILFGEAKNTNTRTATAERRELGKNACNTHRCFLFKR